MLHPSRRSDNLASCLEPCYEELQLAGTSPCLQIKPYSLRTTSAVPKTEGAALRLTCLSVSVAACLHRQTTAGAS